MTTFEAIPIPRISKGSAYITSGDGKAIPLGAEELRRAFDAIMHDDDSDLITTGEAAQILGVSSKTVARIRDAGEIPFTRYGAKGNRMVSRARVVAYRNQSEANGHKALEDMRVSASRGGLDDVDHAACLSHFN
ncbi:excisionase family DNA-binding domain-containing protein [Bifidobacterium margollesii]|uniref:Excisionase family DNA-binding domain-containing protein n=1 Tax=Bifidobacterium margollesii TaxID=2020964 RepID=A0A2N5JBE8_9BIFI|nr:helix-turn-helix domain-containing protein [Bifidobacterium margollesii]PLS31528.1 excisionase family DNA-binding domain-containing protein [Bifidobacterium margollesii]